MWLKFFQVVRELQIHRHINKLKPEEIKEMQLIHLGYLSGRPQLITRKNWLSRVPFVEFPLALECQAQPGLFFGFYRLFRSQARDILQAKLGDQFYVRSIAVNDPELRWYYVLELVPADKLTDFPLRYKEYLLPHKLNCLR
ncbi:hypothetical protein SAMN02745885_00864 [Carboxydocella sporoproducens DSM 16521]|uniref:Uncharacterized protein n=2 Tax=Carboxydocella TaxID=178898 RepID=A0A1T4NBH7_9FIRM|nr:MULTISPECIES: hypothetical protein [Carboxydocella]AVX20973.1 hypothetical protein CFE_1802 [Carboxydocella thermautotrophica]SJZ76443.1 hypothetical protein SAMN02745885_00864 [Carboxydocella sporoproducens DSM 16521]